MGVLVDSLDPRASERLMAVECLELKGQVHMILGVCTEGTRSVHPQDFWLRSAEAGTSVLFGPLR